MGKRIHRALAGLMLVLLPLQAVAATVTCPRAEVGQRTDSAAMSATGMDMENCSMMSTGSDTPDVPQPNGQYHSSCCATAATCPLFLMATGTPLASNPIGNYVRPDAFTPSQYVSFIPEGLHRPPRVLA